MRTAILLFAFSVAACAQPGWHQETGTKISTTICPANGASGSVGNGGGAYAYQTSCHNVLDAWSSCAFRDDTTHVEMYCFGGGHTDYGGNEVYKIDLLTNTASRITNPSTITQSTFDTCPSGISGVPNSRHTYQGFTWMVSAAKAFLYNGGLYCGNGLQAGDTWTLDPSGPTWAAKDPVAGSGCAGTKGQSFNPTACSQGPWQLSVWDSARSSVWILPGVSQGVLFEYTPADNTYILRQINENAHQDSNMTVALDTSRHNLVMIGGGSAVQVPVGSGSLYAFTDVTSSLGAGCATLRDAEAPGWDYIPSRDVFVGFPPNGGSVIYTMDPVTYACTSWGVSGGPPDGSSALGLWSRLRWSPTLQKVVVLNAFNQDVYSFTFPAASSIGGKFTGGGKLTF